MSDAVIVGGGIGGLATALSLAGAGHRVIVLERAERFAEIGAGIQIAPNGIHALDALGVGRDARQIAVRMDELRFMDGVTDRHVTSLPLTEEYQQRFGTPYLVVHRAELHRLLLDACLASTDISLRSNCTATGYEQAAGSAAVVLHSGERVAGDVVIGADGIHSQIRRQLVADGAPRVSGLVVYRTMVAMEEVPEQLRLPTSVTWWTGPERHLVHYPIAGGRYLNLAGSRYTGSREPIAGRPVSAQTVQGEFAGMGATTRRLIALGTEWKSWALVDRDPVESWVDGRVALLGDAAHPMLHYAAQGACQALEDAVVLGRLLDCSAAGLPERLVRYNAQRRHRTARIQLAARESIRLWHAAGPAARARNAVLSAMSERELHDYIAWMHTPPILQPAPTG
ncbi:FAD-dependent oxidoreductase [Jatrophihabitans sp.]|uniref:FAD-dependent oxidoreductase n=1 Tax=Jatrophihabitans sp. TaxID=1932789 RepID=UPI002B758CD8|nr:FAD-dependent oxidoreductase [Jatrophihabitans sp.]